MKSKKRDLTLFAVISGFSLATFIFTLLRIGEVTFETIQLTVLNAVALSIFTLTSYFIYKFVRDGGERGE